MALPFVRVCAWSLHDKEARMGRVAYRRHNLTEATRDMVKKSTEDVKILAAFPTGGPHVCVL
jgi:hypothetical protein